MSVCPSLCVYLLLYTLTQTHKLLTYLSLLRPLLQVLEAQSYLGGRVKQTQDFIPGLHVDLGAELVHGSETTLMSIINEAGIARTLKKTFVWASLSVM